MHPAPVDRLITELGKLPGIGRRTAQRLAYFVLRSSDDDAFALAAAIREVKESIGFCEVCFNLAEGPHCVICADTRRGRYHVLGGALSPIDGVDPEDLKIAELYRRVEGGDVREVVLATNSTTTGEATALFIADGLHERAPQLTISRLASGLPVGGDLEYADEVTLGRALAGRRAL